MTTQRRTLPRAAGDATTRSTASSQLSLDFSGREPLAFGLALPPERRLLWLAARLEAYREATVAFAAVMVRERGGKVTVAEAEAQAVIETDGFTKLIPMEQPLYPFIAEPLPAVSDSTSATIPGRVDYSHA